MNRMEVERRMRPTVLRMTFFGILAVMGSPRRSNDNNNKCYVKTQGREIGMRDAARMTTAQILQGTLLQLDLIKCS